MNSNYRYNEATGDFEEIRRNASPRTSSKRKATRKGGTTTIKVTGIEKKSIDIVECDTLNIDISGCGYVRIYNLRVNKLNIRISGAGGVKLGGTAQKVTVHVSGIGNLDIRQLEYTDYTESITGIELSEYFQ